MTWSKLVGLLYLYIGIFISQVDLYNHMVEKEGTDGEEEAKTAYKAARKDSNIAAETALGDKASSALIERVNRTKTILSFCKIPFKINHN